MVRFVAADRLSVHYTRARAPALDRISLQIPSGGSLAVLGPGGAGKTTLLRQFALVVVISTLLSLFVSFTLTPLLASRFAKFEKYGERSILGRLSTTAIL